MAIFCQIAILALFSLCINFKISFCQMTSHWVLWKTYYTLFLNKCLWPCPDLSMYLSERINCIISSFPHRISKILFVPGISANFQSLGYKWEFVHSFANIPPGKTLWHGLLIHRSPFRFIQVAIKKPVVMEERSSMLFPVFSLHPGSYSPFV